MTKLNISKQLLVSLIKKGFSAPKIAEQLSCNHVSVLVYAEKFGIKKELVLNGVNIKKQKRTNLDKDEIEQLLLNGMSGNQISKLIGVSLPTVLKYSRSQGFSDLILKNSIARKASSKYKDGRASYRKYKKSKCEICNTSENRLEVHHKKPAVYDSNWSTLISGDHGPENLVTVCNSCHQKTHYREHGRSSVKSNGKRFFKH